MLYIIMLILNYFDFNSIYLGINRFHVFWCCEITWIILTKCCMSIVTSCWVAFLSRAFGCSLLNRPIPTEGWRGECLRYFSPVSMPNVHFITFDWQKSTMLFCLPFSLPLKSPIKCHFIDNWFAGVPVFDKTNLHLSSTITFYCR